MPALASLRKCEASWMLPELAVLLDVGERRERVPDVRGADAERRARAVRVAALAVGLATGGDEVAPADAVLVQQVGDVGPRVVVGGRDLPRDPGAAHGELVVDAPPALRHRRPVARARRGRSGPPPVAGRAGRRRCRWGSRSRRSASPPLPGVTDLRANRHCASRRRAVRSNRPTRLAAWRPLAPTPMMSEVW